MANWVDDFVIVTRDSKSKSSSIINKSDENVENNMSGGNKLAIEKSEEGDDFYNIEFNKINKVSFLDVGDICSVDKLNKETREQFKEIKNNTKENMDNYLRDMEQIKKDNKSEKKSRGRYSGYCCGSGFLKWLQ